MWQWILDNSAGLSVLASVGTLLVWLFYAQLLLAGFRRQRQARILINQGWGDQLDSVCLVSNMSHEPIYIQCILLELSTRSGRHTASVTDLPVANNSSDQDPANRITRQGPLASGGYMNIGSFRRLIAQSSRICNLTHSDEQPVAELELVGFKLTVISSYGPEAGLIGSTRQFDVSGENNERMRPATIDTGRMRNRDAREQMRNWLNDG